MINKIKRMGLLAQQLLLNLVYIIASIPKRDKKIWLFSAWNGKRYSDNPRCIFEYTQSNFHGIDAYWITKNHKLNKKLQKEGIRSHHYMSPKGILLQLKAGVIVFTHSAEWDFFAPLLSKNTIRVQTWHGIPIKKIGYDDKNGTSRKRASIINKILPFRSDRVDLVFAASNSDAEKYRSAFNTSPNNVFVSGYARNDILYRKSEIKNSPPEFIQVIYMPTLRGGIDSEITLFENGSIDLQMTDTVLKKNNIQLNIRLHPVQRLNTKYKKILLGCEHIKLLEHIDSDNFYDSLGNFDILITDYSGIYFDFMMTNKPIIMAPLDIDEYMSKDRDLYYNYIDLCPDTPCMKWSDVLKKLEAIKKNELKVLDPDRYSNLQKKFHAYLDGNASKRCAEIILKTATTGST